MMQQFLYQFGKYAFDSLLPPMDDREVMFHKFAFVAGIDDWRLTRTLHMLKIDKFDADVYMQYDLQTNTFCRPFW